MWNISQQQCPRQSLYILFASYSEVTIDCRPFRDEMSRDDDVSEVVVPKRLTPRAAVDDESFQ